MPLISVIVPVYNVEPYLRKCLDSIINQTYKNLEIILVDDGSPDNCGQICDEYAKKDDRIKVIHKENGGISSVRNAGLDVANGEYISFVDSDDYIAENMYDGLINIAEKERADIVTCAHYIVSSEGTKTLQANNIDNFTIDEIRYLVLMDKYPSCVWGKLYKAGLFKNLRFCIGIYSEDIFIMPTLFFNAKKATSTKKPYYYYNTNQGSIMSSFNAKHKYGFFMAWAEHERVAALFCKKAYKWSQFRAIRSAIGALMINTYRPNLTQKEIENCKNYLKSKRDEGVVANIGAKYKILWWGMDNCLYVCKIYAMISFSLQNLKKRAKNAKH
jgi:glycosyltransferase involved in cell wall biosynthesis